MRSPAQTESAHDTACRWVREGLDTKKSKPDGWAGSMLLALDLKARSYAHRWLTGEQQVPLRAVIASVETHPEVAEHVARNLAAMVGKVLADTPRVTDVLNDFSAFASLGSSAGRVLEEIARALQDGVLTAEERASGVRALDALIEVAVSYRARLAANPGEADGARGFSIVEGGRRP